MPLRRPHLKSRHGCVQCKTRKVKCDVRRPVCSNCERRERTCSLSAELEFLVTSGATSLPATGGILRGSPDSLGLDLQMLELIHHYTTVVCFTFSKKPQVQRLWQVQVPKDALIHPFLMHCIIAVSALHLADTVPGRRDPYLTIAIRHQGIVLSAYKPMLHEITMTNCRALCAGAKLLTLFTSGYSLLPLSSAAVVSQSIQSLLEVAELVRGGEIILNAIDGSIEEKDPLRQVTGSALEEWGHDPALPMGLSEAIETIEIIVETQAADSKSIYLSTLDKLVKTFQASYLNPEHPPIVFMFLILVDRKFIELVKSAEQLALVILAYYGVALDLAKENWWAKDWGARVVQEVFDSLDAPLRSLIQFPIQQVGLTQSPLNYGNE